MKKITLLFFSMALLCSFTALAQNDDCANAIVTSSGNTYAYDTTTATIDNAITCGTDSLANNVWYTYTGSGSAETVTLSTCNDGGTTGGSAAYDSKIFVYTGACGALVCLGSNDDGPGCTGFSSLLEFVSDGTQTYYIAMSGYQTSAGAGVLSVDAVPVTTPPPANDDCSGANPAEALTLGAVTPGDNTAASSAPGNPTCDPFGVISDVWYSFDATATLAVDITTVLGTADAANVAVYTDCTLTTELACNDLGGTLHVEPLVNGTTYYVQVWNDGSATRNANPNNRIEGSFTIVVSEAALSTEDFDVNQLFTYFPNPVDNNLTLKSQSNIQNVAIYNMLGQEVLRTAPNAIESNINMNNLSDGAYFVQVTIDNTTETIRIIKN